MRSTPSTLPRSGIVGCVASLVVGDVEDPSSLQAAAPNRPTATMSAATVRVTVISAGRQPSTSPPRYAARTESSPSNTFASSVRTIRPVSRTYARCGALQRLRGVLLDEQDGGALLVDLGDDREDLRDEHRGEPHRRLVEQQHARARHERAADREHLLLATGERAARLRPAFEQAGGTG